MHYCIVCNYKILCFVETWLCSITSQLDPQGLFNIYQRDRNSQRPAGGVCIFISINLHSMLSEINLSEFEDAEAVTVNVLTRAVTHITLPCAYVPPNFPLDVFNSSVLCVEKLCLPYKDIILVIVGQISSKVSNLLCILS
jgi:hypothetical protein